MRLSPAGVQFIKGEEGLSLTAYRDPPIADQNAQLWSVGYGQQLGKGPQWEGYTITRAEADRLFDADRVSREASVSDLTPVANQQQFDAMVSLAYNIGIGDQTRQKDGGFATSTVQRLHNLGDYQGAADAFRLWKNSAGAVNPVLVARRERERSLYLSGPTSSQPAQSPAPAPSPAPVASSTPRNVAAITAAGLVFFCPSCGARSASVGIEVDDG